MNNGPSEEGQNTDSSDITRDGVSKTIEELFDHPWKEGLVPFLKGPWLNKPYSDFITDRELDFYAQLAEAGINPNKLRALLNNLNQFAENIESEWEAIADKENKREKQRIAAEEKLRDDVFAEFIDSLPEVVDDDGTSGISAGTSVREG